MSEGVQGIGGVKAVVELYNYGPGPEATAWFRKRYGDNFIGIGTLIEDYLELRTASPTVIGAHELQMMRTCLNWTMRFKL